METLDNYKPSLNEEQVIDAIDGLPPPQPPMQQAKARPLPRTVAGNSNVTPNLAYPSYPLAGGNALRDSPDTGPSQPSLTNHPEYRNPSGAQRPRLDSDRPGAAPGPLLSLPGIGDVQREVRELLQRRHFRGLLLERGRPELIRNQPWPEGEVINSQGQYEALHTGARDPRIPEVQIVKNKPAVEGENPHFYKFSGRGFRYPYYGRGPVWCANSCALDSCIVAARLLNVGSLSADKGDASVYEWLDSLPKLTLDFLNLLAQPWETYPNKINEFHKEHFRKKLGPASQSGNQMSAVDIWKRCTEGVNQFAYSEYWYSRCSKCGRETPARPSPNIMQDLALDEVSQATKRASGGSPDMAQRLNNHFKAQPRQCKKNVGGCGREEAVLRRRMVHGTLPPRLVVLAPRDDADKDIPEVTSNHIPIDYRTREGPQTANYRWIGGLYRGRLGNVDHYRVYWADWEHGEYDGGLKVYDGTRLGGAIVGRIPPYSDDDWVPPYWSRRPDVIFYERVDETDVEAVAEAIRLKVKDQLTELVLVRAVPALKCNPKGKYREVETEDPPAPRASKPNPIGKYPEVEEVATPMLVRPIKQSKTPPLAKKPDPQGKDREVEEVAPPTAKRPIKQLETPPPATKPNPKGKHLKVEEVAPRTPPLTPKRSAKQSKMLPPTTIPTGKRKNREDELEAGPSGQRSPRRQKRSTNPSDSRNEHISISD